LLELLNLFQKGLYLSLELSLLLYQGLHGVFSQLTERVLAEPLIELANDVEKDLSLVTLSDKLLCCLLRALFLAFLEDLS